MSKQKIVIIPVHNQLPYLIKCIESVHKNNRETVFKDGDYTASNITLIVVDDGSTEEDCKYFFDLKMDGGFILLRNETAQGFSAACNKGIQYALDNFDFNCLCLLNSDAEVVTENWFDKVEHYFINGDNVGVASVMSDNAMAQTVKDYSTYKEKIDNKPAVESPLVHGFCYIISKKLIETIGLLDEKLFPHYGSEDDYSLKSLKAGFTNIIIGSVYVKHNNETSYTHAVRAKFVKKTLPLLMQKWGSRYVANCVKKYNDCGIYLNNI